MKVSDVISRVRTIAGDEAAVLYTDTVMVQWINDAMRECVTDNMLLQKSGTLSTVVGQSEYDLPADVLKLYSIRYNDSKLPVLTLEEFDERYGSLSSDATPEQGTPTNALIWAGKIRLFPAPSAVGTLKIDYSYSPTDRTSTAGDAVVGLDSELPLPLSYHRRITDYCLAMVAEQDDDMNRYTLKMDEFRTGVQNLKDHPESTHDLYPFISVDVSDMGGYYDG